MYHLFEIGKYNPTNLIEYPWDIQAGFDVEQHVGVDLGAAGGGRQGDVTVAGGVELSGHHVDSWGGGVCLPARLNNRKHRSTIYVPVYNLHVRITLVKKSSTKSLKEG